MSWLAKKLALVFLVVAIFVVLVVALVANLNWLTILKRAVTGGAIFSLIGAIIGQLITNNLDITQEQELTEVEAEIAADKEREQIEEDPEMTPLNFNDLSQDNPNVINDLAEDSEKTAEIIRNLKEEE